MTKEEVSSKIFAANKTWVDYKDLMIITGWSKSKANQVFKKIQINEKCSHPFDTRKARTEIVLNKLGYEKKSFVEDLEHDLNLILKIKGGDVYGS